MRDRGTDPLGRTCSAGSLPRRQRLQIENIHSSHREAISTDRADPVLASSENNGRFISLELDFRYNVAQGGASWRSSGQSPAEAEGTLLELYQEDMKTKGYVANTTTAFSLRPEVYKAWLQLLSSIRSNMRLRRFELVTFAAAQALKCTYCMLAHGAILRKNFFGPRELAAIARDFRNAGLPDEEVALMEFARKITLEPNQITPADFEPLRDKGLSDTEILDVVLTVTARNFMSKTLDALGAEPDEALMGLEPELREALVIGRPFPSVPPRA